MRAEIHLCVSIVGMLKCELTIWPYLLVCWKVWRWDLGWNSRWRKICTNTCLDTPDPGWKVEKIYKLRAELSSPLLFSFLTAMFQLIVHCSLRKFFMFSVKIFHNNSARNNFNYNCHCWLMFYFNIKAHNYWQNWQQFLRRISVTFAVRMGGAGSCHVSQARDSG